MRAFGQERGRDNDRNNGTEKPVVHQNGVVQDWSHRHVVYPRVGEIQSLIAVQNEPRALLSWQAAAREGWRRGRGFPPTRGPETEMHRDWSISLGAGGMAAAMYPAKFSFDPNAAADCLNDVLMYSVNVATSATQPNIVGFNNLYSGTTPTAGICNRTPSGSDTGVAATVDWSYNVIAVDGQVSTSPALSLDGGKVAFVETGTGATAHFHVLAPSLGDGVNFANLQDVATNRESINGGINRFRPISSHGGDWKCNRPGPDARVGDSSATPCHRLSLTTRMTLLTSATTVARSSGSRMSFAQPRPAQVAGPRHRAWMPHGELAARSLLGAREY